MIIKSKPRRTKSFKQLIEYLLSDKGRAKEGQRFVLTQNIQGKTPEEWITSLESNESTRRRIRKNATRVLHEIISFHWKDSQRIDQEKLKQIALEYMSNRSPHGMFLAIPHTEDDHCHIHIAGSPWEAGTGKSLRMSQSQFKAFKSEMEAFQGREYPELTYSRVRHEGTNNERVVQDERQSKPNKMEIGERIRQVLKSARSSEQFIGLLDEQGLTVYERNGKPYGVKFQGRKYRFRTLGIPQSITINYPSIRDKFLKEQSLAKEGHTLEQSVQRGL